MPTATPPIVVAGSLNMDFVVLVERLPAPGETTIGRDFQMIPGGKGANQANAAGRLSRQGRVSMIGCVGADPFADQLKASLAASGVDVAAVRTVDGAATGVALIWVERDTGQNSIVVASGANALLAPAAIEDARAAFAGARCALFQLESPLDTVAAGLRAARDAGALTILDPAPARPLSKDLLSLVDILTPNESEALVLLGEPPRAVDPDEGLALAAAVWALGSTAVVLKLGANGCVYAAPGELFHVPAFAVEAVDATAAGDTFNAALAVALAEGSSKEQALRFANAAAAISVTRLGAQSSAPTRDELEQSGMLS